MIDESVEQREVVADEGLDDVRFVADHRGAPDLHAGSRRCATPARRRRRHRPPVAAEMPAATRSPKREHARERTRRACRRVAQDHRRGDRLGGEGRALAGRCVRSPPRPSLTSASRSRGSSKARPASERGEAVGRRVRGSVRSPVEQAHELPDRDLGRVLLRAANRDAKHRGDRRIDVDRGAGARVARARQPDLDRVARRPRIDQPFAGVQALRDVGRRSGPGARARPRGAIARRAVPRRRCARRRPASRCGGSRRRRARWRGRRLRRGAGRVGRRPRPAAAPRGRRHARSRAAGPRARGPRGSRRSRRPTRGRRRRGGRGTPGCAGSTPRGCPPRCGPARHRPNASRVSECPTSARTTRRDRRRGRCRRRAARARTDGSP